MSALLTWILHGTALAGAMALALRFARHVDAATRYRIWALTMVAVLVLPLTQWIWPGVEGTALPAGPSDRSATSSVAVPIGFADRAEVPSLALPAAWRAALPLLLPIGLAMSSVRLWRLQRALVAVRRLRRQCRPVPSAIESRLTGWRRARHGGRDARLAVCPGLASPAVLSMGTPIIALPPWAVDGLPPDALDLIVLHEQAHIDRCDDRDLLIQAALEAAFAWHPAVRWVARRMDDERERACDDRVVSATHEETLYAKSLVWMAEHRGGANLAIGPGLGRAGRRFTQRIERVLTGAAGTAARFQAAVLCGAAVVLGATLGASASIAPRVDAREWNLAALVRPTQLLPAGGGLDPVNAPVPLHEARVALPQAGAFDDAFESATTATAGRRVASRSGTVLPEHARAETTTAPDVLDVSARDEEAIATPMPAQAEDHSSPIGAPAAVALRERQSPGASPGLDVATSVLAPASALPAFGPRPPAAERPWARTADAGTAIGRGAAHAGETVGRSAAAAGESIGREVTKAGVKTAGFFSRMGRGIAGRF